MHWEDIERTREQSFADFFAGKLPLIPSAHDPLSAQALEQKGFRMAVLPTEDVSRVYGYTSSYMLNAMEMLATAKTITQVTALALLVQLPLDARSSQQIVRQAYELRQLGIQAIQIDDEKIHATEELTQVIVQMKHYFPEMRIVMTIRADASIAGIEKAVKKANQLLHAGADFVMFEGLYTEGEYLYTYQYTNGPLLAVLNETKEQSLSYTQLNDMGYHATIVRGGCINRMKKIYEEAYNDA
ncbi:isocitrate lyase/phosphoenolpyruvate mutase family protein [Natribacillus halophilus]|uniref:2-Methylisocitrate lyase, PEP mutase family n=1 Tax=Natribacillus halophilus TaxID=549003 RepID=A0A1G8Q416_9BACI|nr:isocitrate lyase/phosphoenolpyruvate mutase family protein [Natribacillus halophilus]SDI99492.1 2-Methylisocitrate lyase, PEP mutase family [Natribacillus halophilus]